MKTHSYLALSGAVFAAIAVLHGFRLIYGWEATLSGRLVPMWISWAGLLISGYLAWAAFGLRR